MPDEDKNFGGALVLVFKFSIKLMNYRWALKDYVLMFPNAFETYAKHPWLFHSKDAPETFSLSKSLIARIY